MTNEEIIVGVAISTGIYTEDEIEEFVENGEEIPLHTLQGWKLRGNKVKKGEHGIETRLWKKKNKKKKEEASEEDKTADPILSREFYLAKAYLFRADQVEIIEKEA